MTTDRIEPATARLEALQRIDAASALPGRHDGLQAAAACTDHSWRERAETVARALAATGEPFTVVSLRRHGVPEPHDPTRYGALFAILQTAGVIRAIGWTSWTGKHGERPVRRWVGTGRGAHDAA